MTTIRISQYAFELSDPFSEGQVLLVNEANALNALRAENIRNAVGRLISRELEAAGVNRTTAASHDAKLLSVEAHVRVLAEVARYDAEYAFGSKRAYARSTRLETLAREIAKPLALAQIRQLQLMGTDSTNYSAERVEELILETSKREDVLVEARIRLEEELHVASEALESLL